MRNEIKHQSQTPPVHITPLRSFGLLPVMTLTSSNRFSVPAYQIIPLVRQYREL
jgi:hypothetical protein